MLISLPCGVVELSGTIECAKVVNVESLNAPVYREFYLNQLQHGPARLTAIYQSNPGLVRRWLLAVRLALDVGLYDATCTDCLAEELVPFIDEPATFDFGQANPMVQWAKRVGSIELERQLHQHGLDTFLATIAATVLNLVPWKRGSHKKAQTTIHAHLSNYVRDHRLSVALVAELMQFANLPHYRLSHFALKARATQKRDASPRRK